MSSETPRIRGSLRPLSRQSDRERAPACGSALRSGWSRNPNGEAATARSPETHFEQPGRVREERPRRRVEPREHACSMPDRDRDTAAGNRLGDVAAVRDEQLQAAGPSPYPQRLQPPQDATRHPDDDHQPEPHPHRERCSPDGASGQQYELRVIARLGAGRRPRNDDEGRLPAGRDRQPPRAHTDPGAPPPEDPGASAEVEPVARLHRFDHDRLSPGTRHHDDPARGPGERHMRRRGDERDRRTSDPRARRSGREEADGGDEAEGHRPISV